MNDRMRYFFQRPVYQLPCDICGEVNYLEPDRPNRILASISVILGVLTTLPFLWSLWWVFEPMLRLGASRGILPILLVFVLLFGMMAAINIIYRNYIWATHRFTNRFSSPFLDQLNGPN